MRLRRAAVVTFALMSLLAASCTGGPGSTSATAGGAGGPLARNAVTAELLPTRLYQLPAFDFGTYEQLLRQIRGTPAVVNIWASWCGPCRSEAPLLAAVSREFGDRVQFLGVDILDERMPAIEFMKEFGWTYPSVFDAGGAIRDELGIIGQPATLFYDANGKLVDRWVGPVTEDVLTKGIHRILGS